MKKWNWKKTVNVVVGAVLLFILVGLVAVLVENNSGTNTYYPAAPAYVTDDVYYESSEADMGVANMTMSSRKEAGGGSAPITDNRKIVRSAKMTIRSNAYKEAYDGIISAMDAAGGYAISISESGQEGSRSAGMSFRIPANALDGFLAALQGTGRVVSSSQSAVDKTTEYQDNDARLSTLYQKRDRLNALLAQAQDVADLIEIEGAISDTQYAIERYEMTKRNIDHDVTYSQVDVTLKEDRPADIAKADVGLFGRIAAAFQNGIEGAGELFSGLMVVLATLIPILVPIALIVFVIVKVRRARKAKKANKAEALTEDKKEA